jgi:hypothetical protein
MVDETSKTKSKRLSKGGRIYARRLKQEARKAGTAQVTRLVKIPKKTG